MGSALLIMLSISRQGMLHRFVSMSVSYYLFPVQVWLVLELCPGGTLKDAMTGSNMRPSNRLELVSGQLTGPCCRLMIGHGQNMAT